MTDAKAIHIRSLHKPIIKTNIAKGDVFSNALKKQERVAFICTEYKAASDSRSFQVLSKPYLGGQACSSESPTFHTIDRYTKR